MHSRVIINPAVTSPAANRRRVYFQADSRITVNFSWIFFPQAHEASQPKWGLPVSPQTARGWGQLGATRRDEDALLGCQAAGPFFAPPLTLTNPLAALGTIVTTGSDLGGGGGGGKPDLGGGEDTGGNQLASVQE